MVLLARAGILAANPHLDDAGVVRELVRRRYGEALAQAAYGSDRQWRDVLGILRASGDLLDCAYLDDAARQLDLTELLTRARAQA